MSVCVCTGAGTPAVAAKNCLEDDTTIWEPGETNQENGQNLDEGLN